MDNLLAIITAFALGYLFGRCVERAVIYGYKKTHH